MRSAALVLVFIISCFVTSTALACSTCGCTLNTDLGNQGTAASQGWRFDLRYDVVDQTQLREGDSAVHVMVPAAQEVEQRTRNGYTDLGIDYGIHRNWGIDVQVPLLDRFHTTYDAGDTQLSTADFSHALGDIRVVGRYTGFSPDLSTGLLFGLKLPTGSTDRTFSSGPDAGLEVDRSLQPGSGTTDALLGAYHFDDINTYLGWFTQVQYQHPLAEHGSYAAGDSVNLNTGLRFYLNDTLIPQLQLNLQQRARDRGAEGNADNTVGRALYISPGLTFSLESGWHGFIFVQVPLYERVNGLQLAPTRIYSVGASYSF